MAEAAALPLLLRQLRLPTIAGCWQDVCDRAGSQGWSVPQTLAALCEYELAERERRRLARHLHESRLPASKTLEHFDFQAIVGADRARLAALAGDTGWVEAAQNVLLFGASGLGKSHLAAALGQALIEQGEVVPRIRTVG